MRLAASVLLATAPAFAEILPASNLLADGTNLASDDVARFQLDTVTPVLSWAPQHTGLLELEDIQFEVSIRNIVNQDLTTFDATFESLDAPKLKVPAGTLVQGATYEWVVDTRHRTTGESQRSDPARFHVGLIDPELWNATSWIGSNTTNLYRTEFTVDPASVASVDLYVCGLSFSTVEINGEAASSSVLTTSPWSNNALSNFFSWFDVTPKVQNADGTVAVGVSVGHGWRNVSAFPRHDAAWQNNDFTERALRAQVRVTYTNGTVDTVAATSNDGSWTTAAGPITADSVYDGETYDSRLEQPGWSSPGFDATALGFAAWAPAQALEDGPVGDMRPWAAPAVEVTETLQPVNITAHTVNTTCAVGSESEQIQLSCPGDGNTIASVNFAAYGTPSGSCGGAFSHDTKCDADISASVESLCKGQQSCSFDCHDDTCFDQKLPGGDPCYLVAKHVAVSVECAQPPAAGNASSYVVDFGRNLAGVVRLSNIHEEAGTVVTLRHAEILQHSGLPGLPNPDPEAIYQANLRSARATDTYTCKGDAAGEAYVPTLTYHGFRFVEITGLSAPPTVELLHFHSKVPVRAETNFSNPTLNRILTMAIGSQESNMMTVPTDCDQRDERLGWMGDADLSSDSMCVNFDCDSFFKSFLLSMADELGDDGSLPDTVPWVRYGGRPGDVSWTAAFPQYVYTLYKSSGDVDTVKQYFPLVVDHLSNLEAQAQATGTCKMKTPYGDWCPPPTTPGSGQGSKPSSPFTTVFSYATVAAEAAELAKAINDTKNEATLTALSKSLLDEFNTCFLGTDGEYDNGLMTTDVLALQLGAAAVANTTTATQDRLVKGVTTIGNHFTTGIIGFKFLFDQLADAGSADVALAVLEQTSYPAMGYEATNTLEPATFNVWELTDAPFEGTGMNSRNHHMFSSFSAYLQQHVSGLRHSFATIAPGVVEDEVVFSPASTLGVRSASSTRRLRHGIASHKWQRHGGKQCAQSAGTDSVVVDCGSLGGTISTVDFATVGPVPHGVCGNFSYAPCAGFNFAKQATSSCVGKQSCTFSVEDEVQKLQLSNDKLCVRDHLGEAPAMALQVTCSLSSSVESALHAPVAVSSRAVKFVASDLMGSNGMEVIRVKDDGETSVIQVSTDGSIVAAVVDGIKSTFDEGIVSLDVAGGDHSFIARARD